MIGSLAEKCSQHVVLKQDQMLLTARTQGGGKVFCGSYLATFNTSSSLPLFKDNMWLKLFV